MAPEDIRTTQLYLSPKYDESDDNWDLVGYEITRSLTVTLRDLKKLNELIDKSIEAGANRLEEIELSSSKEQESKDKTLAEAIMDAKQHATRLAEGFGAKLGKVLLIDANNRHTLVCILCYHQLSVKQRFSQEELRSQVRSESFSNSRIEDYEQCVAPKHDTMRILLDSVTGSCSVNADVRHFGRTSIERRIPLPTYWLRLVGMHLDRRRILCNRDSLVFI